MDKDRYQVYSGYSSREILQENIALLNVQTAALSARVKSRYLMRNKKYINDYVVFHTLFENLLQSSIGYIRIGKGGASKESIDEIRESLNNPDTQNPMKLVTSFEEYLRYMIRSGLAEIGTHEKSFKNKLRDM